MIFTGTNQNRRKNDKSNELELFVFIQALRNDCSHIEDVHHLFCAPIINIFSFLTFVELRYFFHLKCLEGA